MTGEPHPWLAKLWLLIGLGALLLEAGPAALAGAVAMVLTVPAVEWGARLLTPGARESLVRILRLVGLPLAALAIAIVVKDWPAIVEGRPIGATGLAAFIVVATGYALVGLYPAAVGHWLVSRVRAGRDPLSLWDLTEAVRRRRNAFRWLLVACILALGGASAVLLAIGRDNLFPGVSDPWLAVAMLALVACVGGLAWLRASGMGSPGLREVEDVRARGAVQRAVEGVAIAAGIPAPRVRVVAHTRPTAFTIIERRAPTIVFTSGLVALAPAGELEAAAAHELGHIVSDGIVESTTFETMLDLLRIFGAVVLVLYLPATGSQIGAALAAFAVAIVASALIDQTSHEWDRRLGTFIDTTIVLINPFMVAANLLAYVIAYALGQAEDLLADLRAVELTRHPEALHAILRRLRDSSPTGPPLPVAYHFRYFTAEGVAPEAFTPVQASIPVRLAMLERIDPGLRVAVPVRRAVPTCPDCGQALVEQAIPSHYGAPIQVDRCPACGGIWFDDLELYMAGAQDLIVAGGQQTGPPPRADDVECPRCHLALRRAAPYGLPADVWLFECATCEGRLGAPRGPRQVRPAPPAAGRAGGAGAPARLAPPSFGQDQFRRLAGRRPEEGGRTPCGERWAGLQSAGSSQGCYSPRVRRGRPMPRSPRTSPWLRVRYGPIGRIQPARLSCGWDRRLGSERMNAASSRPSSGGTRRNRNATASPRTEYTRTGAATPRAAWCSLPRSGCSPRRSRWARSGSGTDVWRSRRSPSTTRGRGARRRWSRPGRTRRCSSTSKATWARPSESSRGGGTRQASGW